MELWLMSKRISCNLVFGIKAEPLALYNERMKHEKHEKYECRQSVYSPSWEML
jgi:hypothetical protein